MTVLKDALNKDQQKNYDINNVEATCTNAPQLATPPFGSLRNIVKIHSGLFPKIGHVAAVPSVDLAIDASG